MARVFRICVWFLLSGALPGLADLVKAPPLVIYKFQPPYYVQYKCVQVGP